MFQTVGVGGLGLSMDTFAKIVVIALAILVVWLVIQPRYLWTIEITGGKVRKSKGVVPAAFLEDVEAICRESQISAGTIRAIGYGKRTSLRFSRHIPRHLCQRFRNAWCLHH
jgi:hypothetical protein